MHDKDQDGQAMRPAPRPSASAAAQGVCRYHRPEQSGLDGIARIRREAESFIRTLCEVSIPSPDRSDAIRKVREAMMMANASIVVPQDAVRDLSGAVD